MNNLIEIKTMEPSNRLHIQYMLSDFCNFKCNYCSEFYNGGKQQGPKDIESLLKNFRHFLDFYKRNGRTHFEINFLGGEPTLWPHLAEFSRIIKSEYDVKITVNTNCSRTLRWWEQNVEAFDKILCSYHHKEGNLQHYISVLDLIYSKNIPLNALVMMDPTCWDEVVAAVDDMKTQSKYPWWITAQEVHPPRYTSKQKEYFINEVKRRPPLFKVIKQEYKNILKGRTTVTFMNRKKQKVGRNWISLSGNNHFKGWKCNLGIELVAISKDGTITGTCNNKVYNSNRRYNLYDEDFVKTFNPKLVPTTCEQEGCWAQPEMRVSKWKP